MLLIVNKTGQILKKGTKMRKFLSLFLLVLGIVFLKFNFRKTQEADLGYLASEGASEFVRGTTETAGSIVLGYVGAEYGAELGIAAGGPIGLVVGGVVGFA
ncbi:MAG TPA: hypothetical protein VE912_14025 [Bacteroidales bacterium]|nr:hypothetical protein [Balneolales bacterium]HYX07843.1 hypothetical protein [Bacteroidales bacterium]